MTTAELIAARRSEPWREELRKSKNKERTDIPRVEMNELDPEYRSHTRLEEVNLGLTKSRPCRRHNVAWTVRIQLVWKVVR